jgi:hypothetical protein
MLLLLFTRRAALAGPEMAFLLSICKSVVMPRLAGGPLSRTTTHTQ